MEALRVILNLPWSILTLVAGMFSLPQKLERHQKPFAVLIHVRSFWWKRSKGTRATTAGNIILLGPKLEKDDLQHELIHVEQAMREPFIHPFLYIYQSLKHGYHQNKYEVEAYERAGNIYKDV